jgi:hypothetical protein
MTENINKSERNFWMQGYEMEESICPRPTQFAWTNPQIKLRDNKYNLVNKKINTQHIHEIIKYNQS